jgi:hypothetical protein
MVIDSLLRKAIETRIATSGLTWVKLQHFELKSAEKRVAVTVMLEGEPELVTVTVHYAVEALEVVLHGVETNRKWMTEALSMALLRHGGRIPLPPGMVGVMARMVL